MENSHAILVVLNMSGSEQRISVNLASQGLGARKQTKLLTAGAFSAIGWELSLAPFAVYIAKLAD
jgi:hypothetical protein